MTQETFEQLKKTVLKRQTVLSGILQKHANTSLFGYVNSWPMPKVTNLKAGNGFLKILNKQVLKIYGLKVAQEVSSELSNSPLVSTIDHHGIFGHPFFLNSNLVFSLKNNLKYLICLSTEGISLNNSSWPGSLVLTNPKTLQLERFSFFKDIQKIQAVIATERIELNNVNKVNSDINNSVFLKLEDKKKLGDLTEELFNEKVLNNFPNFSEQASFVSTALWSKIFPEAPKLIYIPLESLVSQVIVQEIISNPSHFLHKLFFTEEGWQLLEKYFTGSLGAFSNDRKGSFLFWGVNKKYRRVHLKRTTNKMEGLGFSLPINANAISLALKNKSLYPTSLVCFLVLLYHQITCLGGFNQVNWLTNIKNKFLELLEEMGEKELFKSISEAVTDNFAETNLAFLPTLTKPTGLDLFLTGKDYFLSYQNLAKQVTVGESVESLLPEIYKIVIAKEDRDSELLKITDTDIAKQNGLERKVQEVLG